MVVKFIESVGLTPKEYSGDYPVEGIKYFRPSVTVWIACPKCKSANDISLSDGVIEYPMSQTMWSYCCNNCGYEMHITSKIRMECYVVVESVK